MTNFETISHKKQSTINTTIYTLTNPNQIHIFDSKQKTITYKSLHEIKFGTINEIAKIAIKYELKSKTPIEQSVKFHITELIKMNLVKIK